MAKTNDNSLITRGFLKKFWERINEKKADKSHSHNTFTVTDGSSTVVYNATEDKIFDLTKTPLHIGYTFASSTGTYNTQKFADIYWTNTDSCVSGKRMFKLIFQNSSEVDKTFLYTADLNIVFGTQQHTGDQIYEMYLTNERLIIDDNWTPSASDQIKIDAFALHNLIKLDVIRTATRTTQYTGDDPDSQTDLGKAAIYITYPYVPHSGVTFLPQSYEAIKPHNDYYCFFVLNSGYDMDNVWNHCKYTPSGTAKGPVVINIEDDLTYSTYLPFDATDTDLEYVVTID